MRFSILSSVLLGFGICLLGISIAAKPLARASVPWTDEQAHDYEAATAKLHALSYQHRSDHHHDHDHNVDEKNRDDAKREYDRLRAALDSARARGSHAAWLLRWSGVVMIVLGMVGCFAGRWMSASK